MGIYWAGWLGWGGNAAWGGAGHRSVGAERLRCVSLVLYTLLLLLIVIIFILSFLSYQTVLSQPTSYYFFSDSLPHPSGMGGERSAVWCWGAGWVRPRQQCKVLGAMGKGGAETAGVWTCLPNAQPHLMSPSCCCLAGYSLPAGPAGRWLHHLGCMGPPNHGVTVATGQQQLSYTWVGRNTPGRLPGRIHNRRTQSWSSQ